MSYGLGIDCGIASVGSGTVLLSEKEEILKLEILLSSKIELLMIE